MLNKAIKSDYIQYLQPLLAFFILPLINLYALFLGDPLLENISYISNALDHGFFGLIWASSCACYLFIYTRKFMKNLHYQNRFGIGLLYLTCLAMFLSVVIPYDPEQFPMLADVHIQISMFATIFYVLVFFHVLYICYFREQALLMNLLPYFICIVGSCCFLYLLMGCVTTLLEIIFVISMGIFLYYCEKKTITIL